MEEKNVCVCVCVFSFFLSFERPKDIILLTLAKRTIILKGIKEHGFILIHIILP